MALAASGWGYDVEVLRVGRHGQEWWCCRSIPHRREWRCCLVLLRGVEQGVRVEADHLFAQPVIDMLHGLHDWRQFVDGVNTRVMRRNYGSLCPDLIDSPQNDVTRLQLMSAAVIALAAWEPRIALNAINIVYSSSGAVTAELSGMLTESMEKSTRSVTLRSASNADN